MSWWKKSTSSDKSRFTKVKQKDKKIKKERQQKEKVQKTGNKNSSG